MKLRWLATVSFVFSSLTLAANYSSPPTWTPEELGSGPGLLGRGEIPDPFPQGRLVPFPLPSPNTVNTDLGATRYGDLGTRPNGTAVLVYVQVQAEQTDVFAVNWDGTSWGQPQNLSRSNGLDRDPRVAVLDDGSAFVTWSQEDALGSVVLGAHSSADGNWSNAALISLPGENALHPDTINLDCDATLWVAYEVRSAIGPRVVVRKLLSGGSVVDPLEVRSITPPNLISRVRLLASVDPERGTQFSVAWRDTESRTWTTSQLVRGCLAKRGEGDQVP